MYLTCFNELILRTAWCFEGISSVWIAEGGPRKESGRRCRLCAWRL